ncbi:ParB/RepB/Spo0J family partition protein [Brucella thiophenivorans]|uniref:ParB/RepB/Spo0J family partition domain protein n=1 Tax=Brucella thiophenivorans TaxID=571255 RepID=A0A256FRZ6_9HYPH|nr:ParB/RepB/Spo0J family partition protein [Brucella thiophenivorans]OYR17617.1 parB/RepB/Spo0J family partition domain protein [Brucella thiophenivorans]
MAIIEIELSNLVIDPKNVRKNHVPADLATLAASIRATNYKLLQNLVIRPADNDGQFYVTAGGRRLAALQQLADNGEIAQDHKIICSLRTDETPEALSLIENEARANMSVLEQFAAFKALADNGATHEEIANKFNEAPKTVRKRLALANLAPEVLDGYVNNHLSVHQLQAFTITEDHARQKSVLTMMVSHHLSPVQIREAITNSKITTDCPITKYVGLDAYLQAGGTVITDLFSEQENSGVIQDQELLTSLFDTKLEGVKNQLFAEGWQWAEVLNNYSDYWNWRQIYGVKAPFTDAEESQLAEFEAELTALAKLIENEPDNSQIKDEYQAISELYDELKDRPNIYDAEALAIAGVVLSLDRDGTLIFRRGYVRPEDEQKKPKNEGATGEVNEGEGISQTLREDLTAHKNAALIAAFAANAEIALVAVVHNLLLSSHYTAYHKSVLNINTQSTNTLGYMKQSDSSKAYDDFEAIKEQMADLLPAKADELFNWLLDQKKATLLSLLAYAAAPTIDVIETRNQMKPVDVDNQLAKALNINMRQCWTATAESYFKHIPRIEIARTVGVIKGESAEREIMAASSKGDAAKLAEKLTKGANWLPSLLEIQPDTEPEEDEIHSAA